MQRKNYSIRLYLAGVEETPRERKPIKGQETNLGNKKKIEKKINPLKA
jgi:hypothetical protein